MRHVDALASIDRLAATGLKVGARAVFLALVVRTDDNGLCWPSMKTLANDTGLSESAARRNVARLVAVGLVDVLRGGGRRHTNLYRLAVEVVPNPRAGASVSERETLAIGAVNPRDRSPKPWRGRDPNVYRTGKNGRDAPPAVWIDPHEHHPPGCCAECDAGRDRIAPIRQHRGHN